MNDRTSQTTNDNAIELRAFRRPDGTIYITSPTWPGFRYLLSGGEGLHEAIEMFGGDHATGEATMNNDQTTAREEGRADALRGRPKDLDGCTEFGDDEAYMAGYAEGQAEFRRRIFRYLDSRTPEQRRQATEATLMALFDDEETNDAE